MLSVHLKSDVYIVGIKVMYVTSLVAAFPDLKQTALQVVLQLASAPMKEALCSESSSDVITCSDEDVCLCTLQDSVAPQSTSARLLELSTSTFQHFVLELPSVTLQTSTAFRSIAGQSGM